MAYQVNMCSCIILDMVSKNAKTSPNGREPLTSQAYGRIKADILSQRLLPRESLIEAEVAAYYEMSKTPVREAMLALSREGLLEINAFRGMRVRDFTAEDAREINELRELLEPTALRQSVPLMDEEDRRRLRELLEEAKAAAARGDHQEMSRINQEFHGVLAARCGNTRMIEMLGRLQDQVRVMALRFWRVSAQATSAKRESSTRPSSRLSKLGMQCGLRSCLRST